MKSKEIFDVYAKYVAPNYGRQPLALVSGKGSTAVDADGKKYLDLVAGIAVNAVGHAPEAVISALKQAKVLVHTSNLFYTVPQGLLAKELVRLSFPSKALFINSGAEAVESAIKLARKYQYDKQTGRFEIIAMEGSFHGRTYGALSCTGQKKYHKGFEPLLPGVLHVPFADLDALQSAVGEKTAAIIIEPVQGESGVHPAPAEYLKQVRKLCDEKGILLIFDEVQCGMARTGKWFGFHHSGVTPDIMTLAKGLGGGFPIGAMLAKPEIMDSFGPGTHASTFGGNPLACSAALAVIETIKKKKILQNVRAVGAFAKKRLEKLKKEIPAIKDVRVVGLMVGIELDRPGADIVAAAREKGLIINCTNERVIRFVPALNITQKEMDKGITILRDVLCQKIS
ncbi:MAG: acetylornithine transaminase [Nitrospinae bacterium]|nr:acetylornithine transaminase [Nitrospinota bacterium]